MVGRRHINMSQGSNPPIMLSSIKALAMPVKVAKFSFNFTPHNLFTITRINIRIHFIKMKLGEGIHCQKHGSTPSKLHRDIWGSSRWARSFAGCRQFHLLGFRNIIWISLQLKTSFAWMIRISRNYSNLITLGLFYFCLLFHFKITVNSLEYYFKIPWYRAMLRQRIAQCGVTGCIAQ